MNEINNESAMYANATRVYSMCKQMSRNRVLEKASRMFAILVMLNCKRARQSKRQSVPVIQSFLCEDVQRVKRTVVF